MKPHGRIIEVKFFLPLEDLFALEVIPFCFVKQEYCLDILDIGSDRLYVGGISLLGKSFYNTGDASEIGIVVDYIQNQCPEQGYIPDISLSRNIFHDNRIN